MKAARLEINSLGSLNLPAGALWGVQTDRSLHFFDITTLYMTRKITHVIAHTKVAATVSAQLGLIIENKAVTITAAAQRIAAAQLDTDFLLWAWQTGSGTQGQMKVNEIIANFDQQAGVADHAK